MVAYPSIGARRTQRRIAALSLMSLLLITAAVPTVARAATYRDCSAIAMEPGAAMHRCDLSGITIIGLELAGIRFARSDLSGVDAGCDPDSPRTDLSGARIYRAILVDALLCDAILTDADLHRSDLTDAALEDASLDGANLSRARLDGAGAGFASFLDANLTRAIWRNGSAVGARLDDADMHRIDLTGTSLRAASLVGADLRYAVLVGTDFTEADLTGVSWRRATGLDAAIWSDTTCPDGTNSDANGGTCVGH